MALTGTISRFQMRKSNYDKFPFVNVPEGANACVIGWNEIAARLRETGTRRNARKTVLVVECYPGVDETAVLNQLTSRLAPALGIHAVDSMLSPEKVDALVAPFLGGNDPVFGFLSGLTLPQFFNEKRLDYFRMQVEEITDGLVIIVGCGASLIA